MGFGSVVSSKAQTYNATIWNPKMPLSTANCPLEFFNTTVKAKAEPFEPFNHLELYDISYIWYSAIAWAWCLVVGLIISAVKPADYRQVDRKLITPAFLSMFSCCPKFIKNKMRNYYEQIGSDLEEEDNVPASKLQIANGDMNYNKGYEPDFKL